MISGRTRMGAVLGWPVEHSASPAMHNAAFRALAIDAVFVALGVKPDALAVAVRGLCAAQAIGLSITVPHKTAMLALCDETDPIASTIGAVNCVSFPGGRIRGHNTDADGFTDSLQHAGLQLKGMRAVLLGGGGASRAVACGIEQHGVAYDVVARDPAKVSWRASQPFTGPVLERLLAGADLLIDCTSTGLSAAGLGSLPAPLPLERLPTHATVVSLVYHRGPELLAQARNRGLRVIDGAGMLAFQGARAFEIWTGHRPALDVMLAAVRS